MGMIAPEQRIASAFFVIYGKYGDVTRYSQERGVCRQWIYREAAGLRKLLATARQENEGLREQLREADEQRAELEAQIRQFQNSRMGIYECGGSADRQVGCGNW